MEELEKQVKGSNEEKQLLWEENAQLRQDILAAREQLNTRSEESVESTQERSHGGNWPLRPKCPEDSPEGIIKQVRKLQRANITSMSCVISLFN